MERKSACRIKADLPLHRCKFPLPTHLDEQRATFLMRFRRWIRLNANLPSRPLARARRRGSVCPALWFVGVLALPSANGSHYLGSMTQIFDPRLDILPASQRRLWDELGDTPADFILYGGTALALRIGHRKSVDFDFFSSEPLDPAKLLEQVPYLKNASVIQSEVNTLTVTVRRRGPVKLSYFGVPRLRRVGETSKAPVTGLRVASLLDLAGTKAAVVQRRAEAKDYIDVAAILSEGSIDLPLALASAKAIYGAQFNPQNTLKALVFFDEGNLQGLSQRIKKQLVDAVRGVDLSKLPHLTGEKLDQGRKR
ncbi:nucleotidyl transferase AbiEii/AbiGii toxin family protein [Rhodomicrobium sp. Az07]|uniref:nucleotidyl transferase AbiEii/AbiGii toxin family protein n=1 Tax=Rhodomicrobium sp. Az07 TaxID=2839034 RepID=UPI002036FC8F|nr:nucleotidyl transferase AbiEii/AbiGii toxin family protein [Rhodomicrobium sp. Az07]